MHVCICKVPLCGKAPVCLTKITWDKRGRNKKERESHRYLAVCGSPAKGCHFPVFIECYFEKINKTLIGLL